MTRLYEILISMAIVAVLFVLVAVFLPSSRTLVEQSETNRQRTIVFDTLNSFRRFGEWNPIMLRDPQMRVERSGPEEGVGARLSYESDERAIGKGAWEIVESDPGNRVVYAIESPAVGSDKRMDFTLRGTGRNNRNIEITQRYHVDYGWNLLGRYAGMYVRSSVGEDMKIGMRRLSTMLAQVPNVDYRVEGSKLRDMSTVDRPAENLLVVFAGAVDRNNQKIKESMEANSEWIKRAMDANNLEPAGPMRIVTSELGREAYIFDVAQPVRRKASGGTARSTGAEGEEAAAAQPIAANDGELTGLDLPETVKYERTEPGRAARALYTGYMAELENVRNALRAWAMTHGHEAAGRPYEYYVNGIDAAFTAEGEYEVYWPLRDRNAPVAPAAPAAAPVEAPAEAAE
nr:polyketide cyclase [Luteimonas aestuarii]